MQHSTRDGIEGKECTDCGKWRPLSEYYKHRSAPDDLRSYCKKCISIRNRRYCESNRESIAKAKRKYREANREQIKKRRHAYYQANKESVLKRQRVYREKNHEAILESKLRYRQQNRDYLSACQKRYQEENSESYREYQCAYYHAHAEERIARVSEWRRENPGKAVLYSARRRARKASAGGIDYTTTEHIAARWEVYGSCCYLCGAPAGATDHVIPLARRWFTLAC